MPDKAGVRPDNWLVAGRGVCLHAYRCRKHGNILADTENLCKRRNVKPSGEFLLLADNDGLRGVPKALPASRFSWSWGLLGGGLCSPLTDMGG
jgi:hypothetical protein